MKEEKEEITITQLDEIQKEIKERAERRQAFIEGAKK